MITILKKTQWVDGEFRGYKTVADRDRAIAQLKKHGYNYFVCYRDTRAEFALDYARVQWKKPGETYMSR